jgi:hypothetical protein
MKKTASILALALCATGLTACGSDTAKKDAASLDKKLLGKGEIADPALTSALEDQIMVDPSLSGQSNQLAVRPTDEPVSAPVPPVKGEAPATAIPGRKTVSLGQLAARQGVGPRTATGASYGGGSAASAGAAPVGMPAAQRANFTGCGLDVDYSMGWANRLPGDLPLHPQARVEEAAGSDVGTCRLRAVTYTTAAPIQTMVDYYLGAARRAGYSAEARNDGAGRVVGGTRRDGSAYYVILTERDGGGTTADFVANNGV